MVEVTLSEQVAQWTSALADVATVAALVVGGSWTYLRFVKRRDDHPRAEISVEIDHRPLTPDVNLARVSVVVKNSGPVLLPMRAVRCEAYRVSPADANTAARLEARTLIDGHEADLPVIRKYDCAWESGEAEIEPGESDTSSFDFVIDGDVESILVYVYVSNGTKEPAEIGWDCSSFYDLVEHREGGGDGYE